MNISKAAMNKSKCKKSLDFKNEYNNNKIDACSSCLDYIG